MGEEQSSKSLSMYTDHSSITIAALEEGRNQAEITTGGTKSRASRKIPKRLDQQRKTKLDRKIKNKKRIAKQEPPPFSLRRGRVPHGIEVVVVRRRMDRGLRVLQVRWRRNPVVHGLAPNGEKEQTLATRLGGRGEDQEETTEDPENRRA